MSYERSRIIKLLGIFIFSQTRSSLCNHLNIEWYSMQDIKLHKNEEK